MPDFVQLGKQLHTEVTLGWVEGCVDGRDDTDTGPQGRHSMSKR